MEPSCHGIVTSSLPVVAVVKSVFNTEILETTFPFGRGYVNGSLPMVVASVKSVFNTEILENPFPFGQGKLLALSH
jgi:hypothetical protein